MTYELVRLVGKGGMGWVYEGRRALPSGARVPVAIKVMRHDLAGNDDAAALFEREALMSLCLNHNHPNLVTTFDCETTSDGRPYLIMEYVDGVSLEVLSRHIMSDDIDEAEYFAVVRRVACAILRGLAYLHDQRVVHRDISPGNILLGRDGAIKLADMGLSKVLGQTTDCRGTVPYASPEALRAEAPAESFDLFSLASVLYELISGELPFGSGEPEAVYQNMYVTPSLPDSVPRDLAALVAGLLEMRVQDRVFQTARQCLQHLEASGEAIADAGRVSALVARYAARAPLDLADREGAFPELAAARRSSLRWVLGGAAAAILVLLGCNAYLMLRTDTRPPDVAAATPVQCEPASEPVQAHDSAAHAQPRPVPEPAPQRPARPGNTTSPPARGQEPGLRRAMRERAAPVPDEAPHRAIRVVPDSTPAAPVQTEPKVRVLESKPPPRGRSR